MSLPFFLRLVLLTLQLGVSLSANNSDAAGGGSSEDVRCIPPSLTVPKSAVEAGTHPSQLVIAHRGASSHLPEHTIASYRLGLELGADYIQTDIVPTQEGELIAVHSVDLDVTTDVAKKFPDRKTLSKYLNRTGYWTYNFTLEEIQTLKVKQRLPSARSTSFDSMFGIPTLTEVLQLLKEWNTGISPFQSKVDDSSRPPPKPGLVAELKSHPWLLKDANMDLIDLVFKHMKDKEDLWHNTLLDRLCYTQKLKIHEYRLPPLVFQAFEGSVLESLAKRWKTVYETGEAGGTQQYGPMPVPPMMMLVGKDKCLEESFWFKVGDTWRDVVAGLGPDKECLYPTTKGREFMEKATEFNMFVSPWTERPEVEFIVGGSGEPTSIAPLFGNVLEEIRYFFCTIKVHGIFSESVDKAVIASNMGCGDSSKSHQGGSSSSSKDPSSGQSMCYATDREANLYVGLASFVMGGFISLVTSMWMGRRQGAARGGTRRHAIPTADIYTDDKENDIDEDDIEML